MISDTDTIQVLTDTLTSLRSRTFISLRICYEKGEMRYFLSNLPPRNSRHQPVVPERRVEDPSPPQAEPPPAKTRGRGRKRQCVASTPDNQPTPPEQLRRGSKPVYLKALELEVQRESVSEVSVDISPASPSVPCCNQFDVLSNLSDVNQAADDTDVEDTAPNCPTCTQQLRLISNFKEFAQNHAAVSGYRCGQSTEPRKHRLFTPENQTYVCDGCRMIMCQRCLEDDSYRKSLKSTENDNMSKELILSPKNI